MRIRWTAGKRFLHPLLSELRLLRLHRAFHSRLCFPSRVPAVLITRGAGILNLLSIGYASLPLLRPRLTQGRSALPWKPWIFGLKDSHLYLATHSGILSSCSPQLLTVLLRSACNAPLPILAERSSTEGAVDCMEERMPE